MYICEEKNKWCEQAVIIRILCNVHFILDLLVAAEVSLVCRQALQGGKNLFQNEVSVFLVLCKYLHYDVCIRISERDME